MVIKLEKTNFIIKKQYKRTQLEENEPNLSENSIK